MRRLNGFLLAFMCLFTLLSTHFVSAQTSDPSPSPGPAPAPGGAAMADYTELIRLIEATINVDGWQIAGGNSSMMEFRQGVRINAEGMIERLESSKTLAPNLKLPKIGEGPSGSGPTTVSLESIGEWQQPTSLRWVSLSELDKQLSSRNQTRATPAMEMLGGLVRIDYVAYDSVSNGWFLGGPSGSLVLTQGGDILNSETRLPPVLLEDLLTIAPHILNGKGEFGCSIDPDPKRLMESGRLVSTSASMKALARNPDQWLEGWRKTLGQQNTKVIGIPHDSPTGYALLIADAHMKRIAFDLEFRPMGLKSYWQEVETFGPARDDMGLVRWWFSLTDHKIPMDVERGLYHFASSNVRIESEAQTLNEQGKQVVSKVPDNAASAFARNFSRQFAKLQQEHPCFGRLRHVFDLAVAMEIIRLEMSQGRGAPFAFLSNEENQPRMATSPKMIDSIASTHKLPNGSISAVVSGGVTINLGHLSSRLSVAPKQLNAVSFEEGAALEEVSDTTVLPLNTSKSDKPFWR